jgi:hypothetical protein
MKRISQAIIVGMFYAATAAAIDIPFHNPAAQQAAQAGENCPKTVFNENTQDFHNLVIKAGVSENDTRAALSAFKTVDPKDRFTPAEKKWLSKVTGSCTCIMSNGSRSEASCSIMSADDLVFTNFHVFEDIFDENCKPVGSFKECTFQNQANPPDQPVPLMVTPGNYKFGSCKKNDPGNDRAIVRLQHPIKDAPAIPIDMTGLRIREGQTVYALSRFQDRMPKPVDGSQPIAQEGKILKIRHDAPGIVLSSITATEGASGSAVVARVDGRLMAVALIKGGTGKETDHKPFWSINPLTGKPAIDGQGRPLALNYSTLISINQSFVQDVLLMNPNASQMAELGLPSYVPTSNRSY